MDWIRTKIGIVFDHTLSYLPAVVGLSVGADEGLGVVGLNDGADTCNRKDEQ